ncbi:MAG: type II secretion system F family protein [Butyrivibrio sp.]|jgi:type IV pilus assembly protein PilC|nr:type II secretion system F family protein [Butyrivibrio sp.]
MNSYKYTALASGGREVSGLIEAIDELEATAKIRNQYNAVISIKEVKNGAGITLPKFLVADLGGKKLNSKAFTLMCSQFSTILSAGIPIARAVKLIEDKTTDKFLKNLLVSVAEDVEAGRTISASFEDHGGRLLPPTFCETIKAGEEAGDLSGAFESVYKHFDKQTKMGAKVRGALTYPAFVFVIAIVVVIVLMVKVVPTFTAMFADMGGELPIMTQMLIAMSDFVRKTFVYFIIIAIALFIAFTMYKKTPKGAINVAKAQLALPVLGNIAELNSASLFANTMATMIQAGLPMTKAVEITSKVMPNALIAEQTHNMVTRIEEGRTIVDSMREADCFPDILTDMVGVGEETGEMKATLDTVAKYYDNELEQAVASAIAMLEPAVLVFLAVFAGFIVISIYMAMFSMYNYM